MKALELNEMEMIEGGGWSLNSFLCGSAFVTFGTFVEVGLVLGATVTAGTTIAVAAGIGFIGAAVCSIE